MRGRLTPLSSGVAQCLGLAPPRKQTYARVDRSRMVAVARLMPDCQSAVLACLMWQASRQERLVRGPLAGQFVARLSGAQLATMTGRRLRTIRHALRRLTDENVIRRVDAAAGRTAIYSLNLDAKEQTYPLS
jgi:hypothetical protein